MKHVVFAIGSLHGGGAERVVSVWSSALAQKGYRVSVLVYSRMENEYPLDESVTVVPIASSMEACDAMSKVQRLRAFRVALKKLKPSVLISFLPEIQVYVALASFGLRIPRVETIRNNPWRVSILGTKFGKLWLWCFKTCRALIVQSEDQKPFFSEAVQKKSIVIPNPINSLYSEHVKDKYDAASHKIVAAGRLSAQKNYKMMIDAIKLVSHEYEDVFLEIYGTGKLEEQISSYIKEQGLSSNISLMGRSNELYRVYQNADLYMMSSDYEGMPNALMEAMAIGLPCISTDCKTGPRDLIDSGTNGYLVPCNDVTVLAEKIKTVFGMSSEEQQIMGQRAREKVTRLCSEENSLNRLIDLIESI
ncbi:MAG: glycosyltransferase [Clostridia bacterium]|nr:glycosyltransferase [Clostridia bacterium]